MKLIEKIFSVKNRKNHKVVHFLFFRMKFRQQVSNQELLNKINAILCNEEKIIGKLIEASKPKKGKAFLPFSVASSGRQMQQQLRKLLTLLHFGRQLYPQSVRLRKGFDHPGAQVQRRRN